MADIKYLGNIEDVDEVTPIEKDVISYIRNGEKIEDILLHDDRWEVFYHLAYIRHSLFNWIDFKEDAKLLELGCELGALTSLFCQKCAGVTSVDWVPKKAEAVRERNCCFENLNVCAGDIRKYAGEGCYDYIVLMPSYYKNELEEILAYARTLLNKEGTIYIVVKNKIGADVLAGKVLQGEMPYQALNTRNEENGYYTRKQLIDILNKLELKETKFYYPVPDYILTQEVYSQEKLPEGKRVDRVLNYFPKKDTLLFNPAKYMNQIVDNGIFEQCANSFLIECKESGECSNISYVALSTDRESEAAYATKIYGRDKVQKEPLYEEGKKSLRKMYDNMEELRRRGLEVIDQKIDVSGNTIQMPYMKSSTLMQHINENSENFDYIDQLIYQFYQLIMKSSELAVKDMNAMLDYDSNAEWGPILQNAYIDMIPLNCFWNEEKFVFFDQEFKFHYYPAKFVMFRILRYTDLYLQGNGKRFDLDFFKRKYRIEDIWEYCIKEEDKFIFRNRNHKLYKSLYQWTNLEDKDVEKNIERLCFGKSDDREFQEEIKELNVKLSFSGSFYEKESSECGIWRWVNSDEAEIVMQYMGDCVKKCEIKFDIIFPDAKEQKKIDIYIDDILWGSPVAPARLTIPVTLTKYRKTRITLKGNFKELHFENDARNFRYQFRDYSVVEEPAYVEKEIKEVRLIQLELLEKVKEVCNNNDLKYFAIYGTLLGAIRNQGYIPWDDDIDIAMPRQDYNRLLKLEEKESVFGENYFLQNLHTEQTVFFGGYSKLRNSNTTGITRQNYKRMANQGIWIDIFPMDNCADDVRKFVKQHRGINYYQNLLYYKVYGQIAARQKQNWKWYMGILARLLPWKYLCSKLEAFIQSYNDADCRNVAILSRIMSLEEVPLLPRQCFSDWEIRKFEETEIAVPVVYDECLRKFFGLTYMLYPETDFRKSHLEVYYNVKESYETAAKEYRNDRWEKNEEYL